MIVKISGVALCGIFSYALLKAYKPEFAPVCELCTVAVIFIFMLDELTEIKTAFSELIEKSGIDYTYLKILIKSLGTALVAEFAADTARDAGQGALAAKIEFSGRVVIIYCALPLIKALTQLVCELAENM